jgi:hypothetical protein
MGEERIREYDHLVREISRRPHYSAGAILEAEHGSSTVASGGACIDHVHVNLIPGLGSAARLLDGKLPPIGVDHALFTLRPSAAPYILMRGSGITRLFDAKGVPSQYIRRELFASLGREDWDWAVFPNDDVIDETIALWRLGENG